MAGAGFMLKDIPCPAFLTDHEGRVRDTSTNLLEFLGAPPPQPAQATQWLGQRMDAMFAPRSQALLRNELWPALQREGRVHEVMMQAVNAAGTLLTVFVSAQQSEYEGQAGFYWALMATPDRGRIESELVEARNRAQTTAAALAKSEGFVRTITDALPSMIAYWSRDMRCAFANQAYLQLLGKTWAELSVMTMSEALGRRLFTESLDHINAVLAGRVQEFERQRIGPDGAITHFWVNFVPDWNDQREVIGFFVMLNNITKLKETETDMRLAASVFDSTADGILISDARGVILSVNPAFSQMTGYTSSDVLGKNPRILKSDRHDAGFYAALWHAVSRTGRWEGDIWNLRKNGTMYLVRQSISAMRNDDGEVIRYVAVCNDITERWNSQQLLQHMAMHDALTGLANRALVMERLGQLIAIANRCSRTIAVLFLDLDGFKLVNDGFGHEVGDDVLKTVAQRLLMRRRQTDTVARLGGDEFIVLLDNVDGHAELDHIAQSVVATVSLPIDVAQSQVQVGVSIGVAVFPTDGRTPQALVNSADGAMYAAKMAGKNTVRFAS